MQQTFRFAALALAGTLFAVSTAARADGRDDDSAQRLHGRSAGAAIQLGPRPFYLVDGLDDGPLKRALQQCRHGPLRRTEFSIGHRGAALQFPEHTQESYLAAARQGAGIVECDVTFTREGEFVCRHAQNDLHTTTDILQTALAATCIRPFVPAVLDGNGRIITPAGAECRASDLTLEEFRSLRGKMDAFNPAARTVDEFVGGTAAWRTDLYTGRGTLVTLRESIALNERLGVKHTPELKAGDAASINAVFGSQKAYALRFAQELQRAGVRPRDAWPQSFNVEDVLAWIEHTPYGRQAVYLLDYNAADPVNDIVIQAPYDKLDRADYFRMLRQRGVRIVAPPIPALLAVDANGRIVPSALAKDLKAWGFDIITWTLERSDLRAGAARAGFYYDFDAQGRAIRKDSDQYLAVDVLAREVGVLGIFSDWPATVSYYASCMGMK